MARLKLILAPVLVIVLAVCGYYYYDSKIKIIPEELLQQALQNTIKADSYRYHVQLTMQVDDRSIQLSDLDGEKANARDFHLSGKMQEQPIEVYQINNVTYLKDGVDGKWMVIPDNSVFEDDYFMAEINPLASFNFTSLNQLEYRGLEKSGGKKYYVLSCAPEIKNDFLTRFWQDFEYKLYVEKRSKKLLKAEVEAVNKAKPADTLTMTVEIKDLNAHIKLTPPI